MYNGDQFQLRGTNLLEDLGFTPAGSNEASPPQTGAQAEEAPRLTVDDNATGIQPAVQQPGTSGGAPPPMVEEGEEISESERLINVERPQREMSPWFPELSFGDTEEGSPPGGRLTGPGSHVLEEAHPHQTSTPTSGLALGPEEPIPTPARVTPDRLVLPSKHLQQYSVHN